MESTFQDNLKNLQQAIKERHLKTPELKANQTDYTEQKETLKTNKLDLEHTFDELQAKLNNIKSQISEIDAKIAEIESKEEEQRREIKEQLKSFNEKIKEEMEKTIKSGKEDKKAMLLCGMKIMECDSKLETPKDSKAEKTEETTDSDELERIEQKAFIEVAFGIDSEAGRFIGRELKGSVLEDENREILKWCKLIKVNSSKKIEIESKESEITAVASRKQYFDKGMQRQFDISEKRKMIVEENENNLLVILKKDGKALDEVEIDLDHRIKIFESKLEKNMFYVIGVTEHCQSYSNQRVCY